MLTNNEETNHCPHKIRETQSGHYTTPRKDNPKPGCSHSTETLPVYLNTEDSLTTPGKMLDQISSVSVLNKIQKVRKNSRFLAEVLNSPDKIKELRDRKEDKFEIGKQLSTRKMTKKKQTKKRKLKESDTDSESSVDLQLQDEDNDVDSEDACCVGCGEEYSKTKKPVDWIKYIRCKLWLHEDCTKYNSFCDICGKKLKK